MAYLCSPMVVPFRPPHGEFDCREDRQHFLSEFASNWKVFGRYTKPTVKGQKAVRRCLPASCSCHQGQVGAQPGPGTAGHTGIPAPPHLTSPLHGLSHPNPLLLCLDPTRTTRTKSSHPLPPTATPLQENAGNSKGNARCRGKRMGTFLEL